MVPKDTMLTPDIPWNSKEDTLSVHNLAYLPRDPAPPPPPPENPLEMMMCMLTRCDYPTLSLKQERVTIYLLG